jgi:ferrochelatase
MMMDRTIGVIVLSYGTPESLEQIEAYYTHIRRNVPPLPAQLEELVQRYEAIGGASFPLREKTNQQVDALQEALNQHHPDIQFKCVQGLKHAYPFVEDGVKQLVDAGIQEAIGVVLAPHYSSMSVGSYLKRAEETAKQYGLQLNSVAQYHLHPSLLTALTMRIESALEKFESSQRSAVKVIFTAHSLPTKILEIQDPYPDQLLETAQALAHRVGISESNWMFAWQSAGRTATPWLGPDILDVLHTIHEEGQFQRVLICPIGFVSDHLEVLYDIDIECKTLASQLGIHLERTNSLNADPLYIDTLRDVVYQLWKSTTPSS